MEFSAPRRRAPRENIVPMINVVFLLLIFFLISSELAAPPPFEVAPPVLEDAAAVEGDETLYVAADGALAWNGVQGDTVLLELAGRGGQMPLILRADAALPAQELARLLTRLSALEVGPVSLAVTRGDR